jgi:hypothetical protein
MAGGMNGTRTPAVINPSETVCCVRVVGFVALVENRRTVLYPRVEAMVDINAITVDPLRLEARTPLSNRTYSSRRSEDERLLQGY